jgi:hypothetical protein
MQKYPLYLKLSLKRWQRRVSELSIILFVSVELTQALNFNGQTGPTFPLQVYPLHQKQKTLSHKENLS